MNGGSSSLEPGLYLVSVPIGAARDITLRSLDVLQSAELIYAEDTRTARRLLGIHGIALRGRRISSYNDANGRRRRPAIVDRLKRGASICYIPDAGTPLISDPGYRLVEAAVAEGVRVVTVPGPTAAVAALTVSGLPTNRFLFAGYLPSTRSGRRRELAELGRVPATLVFFESARRLGDALCDMEDVLGPGRRAAICRELTKKFEQISRGSLSELSREWSGSPPRGEIVVVVEGREEGEPCMEELQSEALRLLENLSVRDAAARIAASHGVSRSKAYSLVLSASRARKGKCCDTGTNGSGEESMS